MHGCRLVLIGTLVWFGLLAPSAWANATVAENLAGTTVTITTSAINDEFRLSIDGADGLVVDSTSVTDFNAGFGCVNVGMTDARCPGAAAHTRIVINTREGDDDVRADTNLDAVIDASLGAGEDDLLVTDNLQAVEADGGDGPDSFFTGPGNDHLVGGPGGDGFNAGLGSDDLLGGPGVDLVTYCCVHTGDLVINLDNVRNDGDPLLESDLIMDAESLSGSNGDDIITGDNGLNDLRGAGGADRIDGGGGFDRFFGDAGPDTLLTRDGLAESVDCSDGTDVATTDVIDIASECETVDAIPDLQPDRDGDGIDRPLDCNDLDGSVRPGAFDRPGDGVDQNCDGADAVDNDRDRDGFPVPFDCDDGRRDVHPGAAEVLGNRIDEDCDSVADPFAAFPTVALLSARLGAITRVVGLVLVDLDGGELIRLTCKGKGCKFKSRRRKAGRRADSLILDKQVRGLRLRPGAKLTVQIRRADGVRKLVTFTARANKPPKQQTRCRVPGGGRVARC